MASRVNRWMSLSGAGMLVAALLFLSGSGDPLLTLSYRLNWWSEGEDGSTSLTAVERALEANRYQLEAARFRERIAPYLARGGDPVLLEVAGDRMRTGPGVGRRLDSLWAALPSRDPGVRTVIVSDPASGRTIHPWWAGPGDPVCVLRIPEPLDSEEALWAIRSQGGECLLSEAFGAPGRSWREWMEGPVSGLEFDLAPRRRGWDPAISREPVVLPAWFGPAGNPWNEFSSESRTWDVIDRAYFACATGRDDQCPSAYGAVEGWPRRYSTWSWGLGAKAARRLPAALLADLGRDRFEALWRSDSAIAPAYTVATGRPIAPWLGQWTRRSTPPIERDNALTLLGWIGALVWLVVAGAWSLERFRYRAVS